MMTFWQNLCALYEQNSTSIEIVQLLIAIATTCFSIAVFIRTKRMERRLFGKVTSITDGDKNSAAALVIDLTNMNPDSMIAQVQHSIEDRSDMRPLKKVLEADPIINYPVFRLDQGEFKLGYPIFEREGTDGQKVPYGRYITLTAEHTMPDSTKAAQEYVAKYYSILGDLNDRLQNAGIRELHVFFLGPIQLMAHLGVRFANTLTLKLYHYNKGIYYYVGEGRPIRQSDASRQSKMPPPVVPEGASAEASPSNPDVPE